MADINSNLKNIWMKGMEAIGRTASSIASNTKYKVDEMNLVNRRREILADFGPRAYALWQKGVSFPEELQASLQELSQLDEKLNDMRAEKYAAGVKQEKAEEAEPETENDAVREDEAPETVAEDAATENGTEIVEEETAVAVESEEEIPEPETDGPETDIPVEAAEPAADEAVPEAPEEEESDSEQPAPVLEIPDSSALENPDASENASSLSSAINELFERVPSVDSMAEKVNQSLDQMGENLKKFSEGMDQQLEQLTDQLLDQDPGKKDE